MDQEALMTHVRTLTEPVLAAQAVELVELRCRREGRALVLQCLVDTPGGITLDECARLNRTLSELLETSGAMTEPYLFEVASPGLDRPLTTRRDFERLRGKRVQLHLVAGAGPAQELIGEVQRTDETAVTVETTRWGMVTVPWTQIAKAVRHVTW